jgi:hypothetical protein
VSWLGAGGWLLAAGYWRLDTGGWLLALKTTGSHLLDRPVTEFQLNNPPAAQKGPYNPFSFSLQSAE